MSDSKAIGQFFGAFDPVNWHAHVIGGMDSINKPRRNFIQTVLIQKPVQFGLSVLSIGSGALAIIREIFCALGKLLVTPLTLAIGTVRVMTWSRFAQTPYNHLPGWLSLCSTAHRVMLQFTGIVCSALGGTFFLFHGTRFTVKCHVNLGHYVRHYAHHDAHHDARYVTEKKKVKQIEHTLPAVVESPKAAAIPLRVPLPATYAPSVAAVDQMLGALQVVQQQAADRNPNPNGVGPLAVHPVLTQHPPITVNTHVNPKEWWANLEAIHKGRIRAWACPKDQIAVPQNPGLEVRLDALRQAAKPVAASNKKIHFHETHHYQVESSPTNNDESLKFLKNLAQSSSCLVVTLSHEGDKWWKQKKMILADNVTIEVEKDDAGYYAEVLPAGAEEGSERILKRTFALKQNGQVLRRITHYHYEGWRAGTAPDPDRLNDLVDHIQGDEKPIIVQCSDGRGASGVFIACHWLKYQVQEKERSVRGKVAKVKIEKLILQMRTICPNMVAEPAYLQAIYKALAKRFTPNGAIVLAKKAGKTTLAWTPQSVKTVTSVAMKGLAWGPYKLLGAGLAWWNKGSKQTTPPPLVTLHP